MQLRGQDPNSRDRIFNAIPRLGPLTCGNIKLAIPRHFQRVLNINTNFGDCRGKNHQWWQITFELKTCHSLTKECALCL